MIGIEKRELHSDHVTTDEVIRGKFAEFQQELRWLAGLLIGDDAVAEACVVDASGIAQMLSTVGEGSAISPTFATICSAIQIQRLRIAELSRVYESDECVCCAHERLPRESLEFIATNSDVLRSRLDTVCRFALVMCGIEQCPVAEAAQWLGMSETALESAYSEALECLEVIDCETRAMEAGHTAWN